MRRVLVLISMVAIITLPEVGTASRQAGKVLTVKRDVFILRETERKRARPESPLFLLDTVETGRASGTKLYFVDDSVLNLSEMSKLVVKEYLYSAERGRSRAVFRLLRGMLRVFVGNSDMQIHTPTALVGVRGTRFVLWVDETSTSTFVHVIDGEVRLRNIAGGPEMIIRKGQTSIIKDTNPPALVKEPVLRLRPLMKRTEAVGRVKLRGRPPRGPDFPRLGPLPPRVRRHLWQGPPSEFTRVGIKIVFPEQEVQ